MKDYKNSIEANLDFRNKLQQFSASADRSIIEKYISFFNLIDATDTSIVVVQDLIENRVIYVSKRFYDVFGFPSKKNEEMDHVWYRKHFHPNDSIINISGIKVVEYLKGIPIEKRKNYKLIHNFRIKNESGQWIRLIVQNFILELSNSGTPWIDLKLCDLAPVQDLNQPAFSMYREIDTGKVIFTLEGKNDLSDQISKREIEVLELVSEGMRSKEIAEKLFISENTVNNHRRNVIRKMGVSNTTEAIKLGIKMGLI